MMVPRVRRLLSARRIGRDARRGSITVLAAVTLYAIVLLGVAAWAGIQEWADHTLVTRLLADAADDASHRVADGADLSGAPALACLDPSCAPVPCPTAVAHDPEGTTAAGQACRALSRGLRDAYAGGRPRLDVAATLAATRVWVLAAGERDSETPARVYHFPTVCLTTDAVIGVIGHDGLRVHHHIHACAQAVYR